MATTQYIGARYVPLFYTASDDSNNWEAGVQYEPLTIVTYLNQSYTSKIPVPASVGNPADNPTYWILTGAYSAQVEQYRQEVEDVVNDMAALETNTQAALDLLKESNKKYVLISDSYGMGTNPSWTTLFQTDVPGTIEDSKTSIGFVTTSAPNGTFLTSLERVANNMTDEERAEITDIIVGGGFNDATQIFLGNATLGSLRTAIRAFAARALTLFPNAMVTLAWMAWLCYGADTTNHPTSSELDTARIGYNTTYAPNLRHIEGCEYVLMDPTQNDSSLFHPNAGSGSTNLYRAVLFKLLGGFAYKYYGSVTAAKVIMSGDKTATINKFTISGQDELCVIDFDIDVSGTFSNSGTNPRVLTLNPGDTPFYASHTLNFVVVNYQTKEAYMANITPSGQLYVYAGSTTLTNAKLVGHCAFDKDMS